MKKAVKLTVASIVALVILFAAAWVGTYRSGDPKNIQYILWKAGLYKLDLSVATDTMIGDGHSDRLVIGKTKAQIEKRFGPLLTLEQASPYERACYENEGWKDTHVLFIARSSWMVVFDGDKATDLVLIKGC
jgi:hypothetical protein